MFDTFFRRVLFVIFLFALTLLVVSPSKADTFKSHAYYKAWCEANPFAPACVSEALGGADDIEKERDREYNGSYYELDDDRQYVGQDMEDPRDSL